MKGFNKDARFISELIDHSQPVYFCVFRYNILNKYFMIYTFLDQRGRRKPSQSGQGQEIGV